MGAVQQIAFGTALLTFSALIHVWAIATSVPYFAKLGRVLDPSRNQRLRLVVLITFAVSVLVAAHTVQIWTWALAFLWIAELPNLAESFYFTTVTYTTLGYGDIVLGLGSRIVATFCAITGLLTFGISTAFLVGVLSRVLPKALADDPHNRS